VSMGRNANSAVSCAVCCSHFDVQKHPELRGRFEKFCHRLSILQRIRALHPAARTFALQALQTKVHSIFGCLIKGHFF